jgi:hypothetical protein
VALHATTIRFGDRGCTAIAALIRAVLDELDTVEEAMHTAHDLLGVAREVRRLAEVDPPGPPRANAEHRRAATRRATPDADCTMTRRNRAAAMRTPRSPLAVLPKSVL